MGHFRSCHRLIRDLVADAESRNDLHTSNHTRAGSMLHIELMHNNPDAARDDIDACTTDLSQQGFTLLHMYALRGRICRELYLGNGKEALELAGQLHRRFKRSTIGQVALMQIYDLEMQTNSHLCAAREELLPVRDVVSLVRSNSQRILRFGLGWTNALAMLWEAAAFQLSGNTRDAAQSYLAASEMFAAEEMLLYQHAAGYRWGMITGGQAGEQAVEKAVGALRREDVARPAAVIAMVAPRMVK